MKSVLFITIFVLEYSNNWILASPKLANSKPSIYYPSISASAFRVKNVPKDNGKRESNYEEETHPNSRENLYLHNDHWLIRNGSDSHRMGRAGINTRNTPAGRAGNYGTASPSSWIPSPPRPSPTPWVTYPSRPSPWVPNQSWPPSIPDTSGDICRNIPKELLYEIQGYQAFSNKIIQTVLSGAFKGRTYKNLGYFVDKFGSRVAGSDNLENAIDFMLNKMEQDGLENVHGENATIPHWVRGEEKATLITPRVKDMSILGLGYSVGTPPEGITAPVLVVRSFDELKKRASEAKGKIVVYNEVFVSYEETVDYRDQGANRAAEVGALAVLIRSITPFSLNTPHTGMLTYDDKIPRIPSACITIEDAELLDRMQSRGDHLTIHLLMNDSTLLNRTSRNSVAEIKGRERPDSIVVISGHLDSWDVGQGAMDDGGGAFISAEALALLRFLNLRPRRTLRTILWTSEEFGLIGAQQYVEQHANELDKFNAVFESDIGTFKPLGLDFAGSEGASCIVQQVLRLLSPINATLLRRQSASDVGSGTDIWNFLENGVPGFSLNNQNDRYFWYHHSQADTMTVENSDELDLCLVVWAVASYVIADLSVDLPRT